MFSSQNSGGCRCEFPVQRFKKLVHRYDTVDKVAVGADKGKAAVKPALTGGKQRRRDTVGRAFDLAGGDAVPGQDFGQVSPALALRRNSLPIARPGIPTGLWIMVISS